MKIENLKRFQTIRDGIGDDDFCERVINKINELIDAHNGNQVIRAFDSKDLTFEEALVHFRKGKKIGRKNWIISGYFNQQMEDRVDIEDINSNDWRVIE
jgi:hypothetical protein